MAIKKRRDGLVTATAPTTTTPFDVQAFIRDKDRKEPGFAAAVEAEIAALKIDEQLRDARKAAELSQAVVAGRMGITQSAVAQLERADPGRMEVRTLAKMATAMGYSLVVKFERRRSPAWPKGATISVRKGGPIEVSMPGTPEDIVIMPKRRTPSRRVVTRKR